ncbi:uncharacterized protein LOC116343209 [Contarinia nasturtii]|uniref:uncharacterized protein LOC116343209 n=1 Tax=Contarinia nasturtii TaxID=265458 RepID=UPI0012D3C23B|nr:uncharacterized protein LOC116343209 [Contarinia nasturtii]
MSRCLRSTTRFQKLQAQQIKQFDKALQFNISKRSETKIDAFDQQEFLSLFGLMPCIYQNGTKKRKISAISPSTVDAIIKDDFTKINRTIEKRPRYINNIPRKNRFQHKSILERRITEALCVQTTLLARKQYLLKQMLESVANQRKCNILHEQAKQRNIILKMQINELQSNLIFLWKPSNVQTENQK